MTKYQAGVDALSELNKEEGGGSNAEFSSFKSGSTYHVKVLGTADLISFFSYGIYKVVNSFVAENPSKKTKNGYPVENLTPWDKAYVHHKEQSKDFSDAHGQEASKYRAKQRFAMGFFDLSSGEPIIVDVSKNQAQAIHGNIKKYEKRLGQMAFELSKQGTGTNTTVSLSPVMFPDEDLSEEQRKNLEGAPESFDMTLFDGLLYEADDDEQITHLITAGFDISAVGLKAPEKKADEGVGSGEDGADIEERDLPF